MPERRAKQKVSYSAPTLLATTQLIALESTTSYNQGLVGRLTEVNGFKGNSSPTLVRTMLFHMGKMVRDKTETFPMAPGSPSQIWCRFSSRETGRVIMATLPIWNHCLPMKNFHQKILTYIWVLKLCPRCRNVKTLVDGTTLLLALLTLFLYHQDCTVHARPQEWIPTVITVCCP